MLEREQEFELAKRWREHGDRDAANQLVTSHLRLVVKIAMGYRGYGLPVSEIISEGNVGLMHALNRFEPEKGFRFTTYAMWWIKASIQDYILRSWSLGEDRHHREPEEDSFSNYAPQRARLLHSKVATCIRIRSLRSQRALMSRPRMSST